MDCPYSYSIIPYMTDKKRDSQEQKDRKNKRATLWRKNNPQRNRENHSRWRLKRRVAVLKYYSKNEKPFCKCCGESQLEFLAIDHIKGFRNSGVKREIRGGTNVVEWLIKNNFPIGFQVLCHNCNLAKGFYGKCPHQQI